MAKRSSDNGTATDRELLQLFMANVQDHALFVLDGEGRVQSWNAGAERLLGYSSEEVRGTSADRFFTDADRAAGIAQSERDAALAGEAELEGRWLVRKDGGCFWATGTITPLRDSRGRLRGFARVVRDRTEWKKRQEAAAEQTRLAAFSRAVSLALIQSNSLVEVLRHCAEAMVEHLEGAFARIWTLNQDDQVLELRASAGMYTHLDGPHSRVPVGKFKIGLIAQERQPHLTNAVVGDPRVGDQEWARENGMVAFAGYPLVIDDRVIGVMAMFARHTLTDATLQAMASVANGIALGIERKLAEEERSQQREWLNVTLQSIGDAVIATDTLGRVTFLNQVAQDLTGWTQAAARGKPLEVVFQILHEYTRQPIENPVSKVLREGRIVGLGNHTILVARDGQIRPIDDSAAPIRGSAGELLGVVLVFRDVTEQRRAENDVRESVARKTAILETALDCVITMDHQGNVVEFNPAAEGTFGYSREQVIGRPLAELIIPPRFREQHYRGLARYLETGEGPVLGRRLELEAIRSDGTEFPVELSITRIHSDDHPLFTAYLRDISERRRAETELKEQTATAETLNRIGMLLAEKLDQSKLIQIVANECTQLSGAECGVFFYNVVGDRGESYSLYTLSAPGDSYARFPIPQNADQFFSTFRGQEIVRWDDAVAEQGEAAPYFEVPEGSRPVRSYLAVPVLSRSGEPLGGLFFGHSQPGMFTERHERLLAGIAGQAAVALDNAQLYQRAYASAERLNLALAAAELGDWSWDASTDMVTFSERAANIFGIPAGPQLTWTAMRDLIHPDERDHVAAEVTRIIEERTQYDIEYRVCRADGSCIWVAVQGRAIYNAAGQVLGMFGVIQDVSDRKQLEQSVFASEERFRGLMEQAPFSIQIFRPDGVAIRANQAWEELWGTSHEQIAGYNILHDVQLEAKGVMGLIRRAFAGEPVYIPPVRYDPNETIPDLTRHSDPVRWVAAVAYPLKDDSGRILEVVLVHDDVTARRRAETAVRESEEKLRLLANTIPQLAWMAEPDGNIFWYNLRWYEYTGTTPEQMQGWGWQSVHDPAVLPAVLERWRESLRTGRPFDMVFPLRGADGVLRPFLTRVMPLRDEDGRILYWFGTNTDITELREAREALATSEERLRLALEAGRMGVWDWNIRTNELNWSDSLEPLHGLEPGTFAGTLAAFQELIYPADRELVNRSIELAVQQRSGYEIEFRNVLPDGSVHWIAGKGKVFCGEDGEPVRMIGIGMDVTQRKRAEQRARFLADASATLALLVDFDSTLQKIASLAVPHFADWAAVDLLEGDHLRRVAMAHVDPEKMQWAQDLVHHFHPDATIFQSSWRILRSSEAMLATEITEEVLERMTSDPEFREILRKLRLMSLVGVPLKVRGRVIGVLTFVTAESGNRYDAGDLVVAEDLAHRAAIAIENAQLYRELREADQRKDEFLATLAHELRNPLAPIRNGLQILRLAGNDGHAASEAHAMMERQLSQMVRLVDDLLDVSRITRNRLDLRKQRVDLRGVVQSAIETSRPLIEQAGHRFDVSLPDRPVHLEADSVRLAQVFSNLLNNSAKYTDRGGQIALAAELDSDHVVVRVRDNGLGIPPESLPKIFEMFSQVDRHLERSQGGLGIGLTLVRRLVEMHGGTIEARSAGLGHGSEFIVRLPVLIAERSDAEHSTSKSVAVTPYRRRVLVVDDNRDSAMSLGMMLRIMGNETRMAEDGLAAVAAAEEFRPDVILLDIGLPKLNGYDACRRIREQPWSKAVTIIALTGWGQDEDRRRSQEAGFDHHLVKPVDVHELSRMLLRPS